MEPKEDGGRVDVAGQVTVDDEQRVHTRGYYKLAHLMDAYPEVAIFRRFRSLTMLSLLSLQSEIVDLEGQLYDTAAEDDASNDADVAAWSSDFYAQRRAPNCLQHGMISQLREKLLQYRTAPFQM